MKKIEGQATQSNSAIDPQIYEMIRKGLDFNLVKSKALEAIKANQGSLVKSDMEKIIEMNFTQEKYNFVKRIADRCTYEQFNGALVYGDFPATVLSKKDMELLRGGVPASMQLFFATSGSTIVSVLSAGAAGWACAAGICAGAASCEAGGALLLPGNDETDESIKMEVIVENEVEIKEESSSIGRDPDSPLNPDSVKTVFNPGEE